MHVGPHHAPDQLAALPRPEPRARRGLICQRPDAGAAQLLLGQRSAAALAGVHVALAGGGAGRHTSGALRVPAGLALVGPPPYSPGLNPVERLWPYLRERHGPNRVDRDAEALGGAVVAGWRAVCLGPETIQSVCRCEYAQAGTQFPGTV